LDTLQSVQQDVSSPTLFPLKQAADLEFNPTSNSTTTVSIVAQTKYEKFLSNGAKDYQSKALTSLLGGNMAFTFTPQRPLRFRPATGAVYSFVRNPTFTAVQQGSDFVIQETDTRPQTVVAGFMLNAIPVAWDQPTYGAYFQFGVTASSDFAVFTGMGIRAFNILSFGGGVAYQHVTELNGQSVGQHLASAADLLTRKTYKPGLYLQIGITLK